MAGMEDAHMRLAQELRELGGCSCSEYGASPPTATEFLREHVGPNRPAVWRGAAAHWPALAGPTAWSLETLTTKLDDSLLTVDVTPDGYGDALTCTEEGVVFVMPEERRLPFAAFVQLLSDSRQDRTLGVPYIQHQNSSFLEECKELVEDAAPELPWATEALGAPPEAVNFWVGDERAVTSFHKDPYENLYVVVAGTKRFTLLPPADGHRMYQQKGYPCGRYQAKHAQQDDKAVDANSGFQVLIEEGSTVPWIPVDPHPASALAVAASGKAFPRFFEGPPPLEVEVHAGDVLYLPAMWYHHVRQQGLTIAVNYWYQMMFDVKYAYQQFMRDTFLAANAEEREEDVEVAVRVTASCRGSQGGAEDLRSRSPYPTVRAAEALSRGGTGSKNT